MQNDLHLLKTLRSRFDEAKIKNPSYSIRAFAKRIGLAPSTLSMVLNGQRNVSRKTAIKIADRLMLDPLERAAFLFRFHQQSSSRATNQAAIKISESLQITADQYTAYSEWYYLAILNLMRLKNFRSDAKWIAARIGVSAVRVNEALERLQRLGMVKKTALGRLVRVSPSFRTTEEIPNPSILRSHHQNLNLLRKSLEQNTIHERDFSFITFSFKKDRMREAKEMIRKFETEFTEIFTRDKDNDEVYRLSVQMIPLTCLDSEKEPA